MENITGKAVTSENYLKTRLFLVDELRSMIISDSVVIEAPRRFGKTSIIKEFFRQEEQKGEGSDFLTLFFELEGVETLDDFCFLFYHELLCLYDLRRCWEKVKDLAGEMWNAIAGRIGSVQLPEFGLELREKTRNWDFTLWKQRITPLLEGLSSLDRHVVIAFDEFPDMLLNFSKGSKGKAQFEAVTDSLTAWLRSLRQGVGDTGYHFVFCGSVNLRKTLEGIGLGKRMNDVETLHVPPMVQAEARLLVEQLMEHYKLSVEPAGVDFMVDKISDGSPYYGQILFKALRDTRENHFSFDSLQGIYYAMLRSGNHDLDHFHSRLDIYLPSAGERDCAMLVLKHLCHDVWEERELYETYGAELSLEYQSFVKVVDRLSYEGYVKHDVRNAGKLSFVSPLLKDWWACKMGVK